MIKKDVHIANTIELKTDPKKLLTKNNDTEISYIITEELQESLESDVLKIGTEEITHSKYTEEYVSLWQVTRALNLINLLFYKRFESEISAVSEILPKLIKVKCSCGYENLVPNIKLPPDVKILTCTNCGKNIGL